MKQIWNILHSAIHKRDPLTVDSVISNGPKVTKETVYIDKELGVHIEHVLVTAVGGCPGQQTFCLKTFSRAAVPLEVELSQRLNHPGFVRVLDYMVGEGCCQVLTADPGPSCWSRRTYGPRTTPLDMLWGMNKVLRSMAHAEALGVVHRDLKVDNIAGNWTITGLSSAVDVRRFRQHVQQRLMDGAVGTPGYMAPEMEGFMAEGGSLEQLVAITTSKLDVYSFGVILYELLTGCLPPAAGRGPLTYPPLLAAAWPHLQQLQALIASCLQADPQQRPSFAQLQQQASPWLAPYVKEAARALQAPHKLTNTDAGRHLMVRIDQATNEIYSGEDAQDLLKSWHRRARRASKPLIALQRLHLRIRHKLAGLGGRQRREAEPSTAVQSAPEVVPAQPSAAAEAAPASAAPLLLPLQAAGMPCSSGSSSSSNSGAVDCVVVVTCVAASSQPAKGKGKVAGWASSMQQCLAARLQHIETFCTQHSPMRLGRPVPVAAC